jgi:hypothetical protein
MLANRPLRVKPAMISAAYTTMIYTHALNRGGRAFSARSIGAAHRSDGREDQIS